jgi:hypothetical protein
LHEYIKKRHISNGEGTILLRYTITFSGENMNTRSKKNKRKINLLEIPENERANIIEELKQTLRKNAAERKLWNYLLQCETLTINGQLIISDEEPLIDLWHR